MSSDVKYSPQYTIVDYQQWEGDWELLDGVAVAMTPSPGGPHQAWAALLTAKFVVALGKDLFHELTVLPEIDWIINRHTVVRPDLVIIQGQIPAGHLKHPPVLIVEILSPATTRKDRGAKFELYQRLGVKYYLIADPAQKQIEVWHLVERKYQRQKEAYRHSFKLTDRCSIRVDFRELLGS